MGIWVKFKELVLASEVSPPTIEERRRIQNEKVNGVSYEKSDGVIVDDGILDEDLPYVDLDLQLTPEQIHYRETSKVWAFKKFLWDGVDKHPKEQRYLLKLDFFLLTSSCLGYFIKNLNQTNIQTAYVNGMNEYYDMTKNQYNYLSTLFTVGYIIGQIPSNMILHRLSARFYLGTLEILWGILTVLMITVGQDNLKSLYAIRFILGFLESGYFPGLEWLLGSNYAAPELTKRSTFFAISGSLSGIIAGPLQQGIIKRFGHSSLPPFKWLFVFDAIISFPIGIYTMFVDPNTPSTTDAWYFTEEDKLVGLERRRRIGAQVTTRRPYSWELIKSFFTTWHIWVFPLLFLCFNNSAAASGIPFTTWMKYGLKKPSSIYNTYPSIVSGIGMTLAVTFAYINDFLGGRRNHWFLYLFFVSYVFACVVLSIWDVPIGLHWFTYFLLGAVGPFAQPFIFSWVNRLLFEDDMKRSFVVVCTNTLAYVTGAWVPILVWDTRKQPVFHIGFTYTAVLASCGIIMVTIATYFTLRDQKLIELKDAARESGEISSDLTSEEASAHSRALGQVYVENKA